MDYDPTKPGKSKRPVTFETELEHLINKYSLENGSDTPDFLLAEYLMGCLSVWNVAVQAREKWYGRSRRSDGEIQRDGEIRGDMGRSDDDGEKLRGGGESKS